MLITGASSGIGFESFKKCFEKDIIPIAACRNSELLRRNISLNNFENENYHFVNLDLNCENSVQSLVPNLKKITKKIDHIVLNAGYIETSPSLMTSKTNIEQHLKIN